MPGFELPDEKHRLSFPGIEDVHAWVTVDGKPLEVYGRTAQNGKAVGHIEATEGAHFEVFAADLRKSINAPHVRRLYLDGQRSLMTAPQTTIRPFLFGRVQLTDKDDEACNDETVIKGLGSITMKYIRVQNVRKATTGHHFTPAKTPTVHERAKKAQLSHQPSAKPTAKPASPPPAGTGHSRQRSSTSSSLAPQGPASPAPRASTSGNADDGSNGTSQLAALEAELESLRRQERIASLQRQIDQLKSSTAASPSTSQRRIKPELSADGSDEPDPKRVKLERERDVLAAKVKSEPRAKDKGKGKAQKPDTIFLSDSD
ncbi:hypothetical protein Rhopal_001311-T1 [Rhodotorula paludigena]|uniref:DUF7918 domain-containing protein n=1 Tax=Rhodotorula paludigena TaxID=86838 RepID=A0AAV5GFD7_9BASI|nr:hypothetical protein Rhopal_001311-T1 [Rhodotorula paludigena]